METVLMNTSEISGRSIQDVITHYMYFSRLKITTFFLFQVMPYERINTGHRLASKPQAFQDTFQDQKYPIIIFKISNVKSPCQINEIYIKYKQHAKHGNSSTAGNQQIIQYWHKQCAYGL